jgi:hypothetical protein
MFLKLRRPKNLWFKQARKIRSLQNDKQEAICHSEGANASKPKSKKIMIQGDVPKVKATEESLVQAGKENQVSSE